MPRVAGTTRTPRRAIAALGVIVSLAMAGCAARLPVSTDDASITARVRTVLMNDPEVDANRITVATASGVVTMTGAVDSPGDAERAVQLARGVEGVRDVRSNLDVEPPGQQD